MLSFPTALTLYYPYPLLLPRFLSLDIIITADLTTHQTTPCHLPETSHQQQPISQWQKRLGLLPVSICEARMKNILGIWLVWILDGHRWRDIVSFGFFLSFNLLSFSCLSISLSWCYCNSGVFSIFFLRYGPTSSSGLYSLIYRFRFRICLPRYCGLRNACHIYVSILLVHIYLDNGNHMEVPLARGLRKLDGHTFALIWRRNWARKYIWK